MKIKGFNINPRKLNRIRKRLNKLPNGTDFFKYLWNKIVFIYLTFIRSTKVAYPSSIVLEVTNHCNLKCMTCPLQYDSGKEMDKGVINKKQIFKIIDEIAPYVDNIGLTGLGETLIHKNLVEILQYIKAKNQGIQTSISTNAHVPKTNDYLLKIIPYLDQLQISIDGIGSVYNQVRVDGNYDFFKENVIKYKSICDLYNVPILFNFTIVKENYHQMPEILDLANELGVQYVNMNPINVTAVSALDKTYYKLFSSESYIDILELTISKSKKLKKVHFSIYDYKTKNGFNKCIYPWIHNYVSWDGFLVPCCARPFPKELHFGNVFEGGLLNCLNTKEFRKIRKMWFKNETPNFCKDCSICELEPINIKHKVALS